MEPMISLLTLSSGWGHRCPRITLRCLGGHGLYGRLSGNGLCLGAIGRTGLVIILGPLVAISGISRTVVFALLRKAQRFLVILRGMLCQMHQRPALFDACRSIAIFVKADQRVRSVSPCSLKNRSFSLKNYIHNDFYNILKMYSICL